MEVRDIGRHRLADNPSDRSDPTDPSDHPPTQALTRIADDRRYAAYAPWLNHADPVVRANAKNAGKQFWGCTAYPECKGIVDL